VTEAFPFRASLPDTIRRASLPTEVLLQPAPILRRPEKAEAEPSKRSRIWEFDTSLHCSIVGTCLSTGELRQLLKKLALASPESTDHQLHAMAVGLASRHDQSSRLLNKALDRRHHAAINQFGKARTEEEVRALWQESVTRGEIPGAYWATLTHPATTRALIREAFGEVHMLSHLVGAANRADIRRLSELERMRIALEARLERQQAAFREAVTERDGTIRELRKALAEQVRSMPAREGAAGAEEARALGGLIADLEKRVESEISRRVSAEDRLAKMRAEYARERESRTAAESRNEAFGAELEAIEALLRVPPDGPPKPVYRLDGITLLYVGGRANQIAHLRAVSERLGANLLHHDGGKEQHADLLGGLVSRADLVLFPVDCVSHDAAWSVKRLCRQAGKLFVPLRSASLASFAAALTQATETHFSGHFRRQA
jgi:hypothetical protein